MYSIFICHTRALTRIIGYDMIKELHKRVNVTDINVEPNEGERTLLCSNESDIRFPSLDLTSNISQEKEKLLHELAEILVEAIIWQSQNERKQ